jgi:hypothetical protein
MKSPYYVKLELSGLSGDSIIYTSTLEDAQRLGGAVEEMRKRNN